MINIAICDDDRLTIDVLKTLLEKYRTEHQNEIKILCYKTAEQYIENWKMDNEANILLLDIEMKELDGIQLKEFLQSKKSKTKILFITSHVEVMSEAFGMNVYGFLKKPVDKKILFNYLDKMCKDLKDEKNIVVAIDGKEAVIKMRDIIYIMAEGRYSFLVLSNGKILSDMSLSEWEKEVDSSDFFRLHKSYIINFKHVYQINEHVLLNNGEKIAIARRRKNDLMETYRKFLIKEVE